MRRSISTKSLGLIVLSLLASATPSWARLNETFDQIRTRYGYAVHINFQPRADYPLYLFQKDGMTIGVRFVDGKSAQEVYKGSIATLGSVAADALNTNSQGYAWTPLTIRESTTYERSDGTAIAHYRPSRGTPNAAVFVLQTSEFTNLFGAPGNTF